MKKRRAVRQAEEPASENDFYPRIPIVARPKFAWPDGARLALAILVSLEHYELQPPKGSFQPVNLPGGMGRAPYPDFRAHSQRAYGNRIGVFRVMRALAQHGLRATAAVDVWTARTCPTLVEELGRQKWEIAGHGHAVTQVISSRMTEKEERTYIRSALKAVEGVFGRKPAGWHSPEYGESERTPALLAEQGVKYVMDWPNDEQPYRMHTAGGPLISVPVAVDFDDVFSYWHRRIELPRWQRAVTEAIDQLLEDGKETGRVLILNLHPWMIGQPWRIGYFEALLEQIATRNGIWHTTAGEIASWADRQL
jgi:allantoinase